MVRKQKLTYNDDIIKIGNLTKGEIIHNAIIEKDDTYEEMLRIYILKGLITQSEVNQYVNNWYGKND